MDSARRYQATPLNASGCGLVTTRRQGNAAATFVKFSATVTGITRLIALSPATL